ncbi:(Fe-S)-binding protein [Archaeoglobus veneficus]|uniref:Fe-S cluster domain protein n=1 Tax=Archaeoglobus veneficus (strain DSM 11195 / SNP6) TaxID=693661 RepID=F2KT89_ARCVS|nr:(Fe-S)-binding protein [Archaeoglobus veneficus]AEA47119.1 Fe-S cluster domain protein [Archaeoglobus veneficus SNP6]
MPNPMEIYKLLPKTNCKQCGEQTCMSFAFKLLTKERKLEECRPLYEAKYEASRKKLEEMLAVVEKATETGLIVDETKCVGCANCVVSCPVHVEKDPYGAAMGKGITIDEPILRIEDGVVKVFNLSLCRRYGKHRTLCIICRENCPSEAISFLED